MTELLRETSFFFNGIKSKGNKKEKALAISLLHSVNSSVRLALSFQACL